MSSFKDLTGQRFGRLIAVEKTGINTAKQSLWLCKCDCGREVVIRGYCLTNGSTKSCGCYRRELGSWGKSHNRSKYKRLYNIWLKMKRRCYNKKEKYYYNYGGRGIKVCNEWLHNFDAFRKWAFENDYQENLTIDRIDNNGNYEPSNCRWANRQQQNRNTRRNRYLTFNGETKVASDWATITGIGLYTLLYRLNQGKPIEEIFYKGNLNTKMRGKYNGK